MSNNSPVRAEGHSMKVTTTLHIVGEMTAFSQHHNVWAFDDEGRAWCGTRAAGDELGSPCEVPVQRLVWRRVAPSRAPKRLTERRTQGTITIETETA